MGEEVLSSYLRRKLSSILDEAQTDSVFPSHIISRFRSIETRIKSNPIRVDLLYQLIESVSECLVFSYKRRTAAVSKKGFGFYLYFPKLLLHPLSELILNRRMGSRLDLFEREIGTCPPNPPPPPPRLDIAETRTPIAADPSLIIGFEAEADKIEALLMPSQEEEEEEEEEAALRAVGIVGRFGCGKTALAQKVFTRARIVNEFSPRIWVSLSNMLQSDEDPTVGVVNHILKEIGGQDDRGVSNSDHMSCLDKLAEELQGKRYLIVLDDAWRLPDEWYKGLLARGFPRGSGGAMIVTSRRENVIRRVVEDVDKRAKNVIRLHLSDEICWKIFTQVVQQQQQGKLEITHPNLCSIRDDVTRNIDGLPLVAKALANIVPDLLLSFKSHWIPARDLSIIWGDDIHYWRWFYLEKEEVAELVEVCWLEIKGSVDLKELLFQTSYSAYLVFKLKEDRRGLKKATARVRIVCDGKDPEGEEQGPVFIDPAEYITRQEGRFPQAREGEGEEGWMEIKLGDIFTTLGDDGRSVEVSLFEVQDTCWKSGLVVKGIELRWTIASSQ